MSCRSKQNFTASAVSGVPSWKSTPERESLVTIQIKADGTGTLLTLTHEQFVDADARDRHQHGWTGALDKLEKLFA